MKSLAGDISLNRFPTTLSFVIVIPMISASPSPKVVNFDTLGFVTNWAKSLAALISGLITRSIPTSLNASSWSGLLTRAMMVSTLNFLTRIHESKFASSLPVVAIK